MWPVGSAGCEPLQLPAAAEAKGCERAGNLSKGKPRTVQKEHGNNLMPFQEAYIKARGFRFDNHLVSLVCLLVSVSLISE